MTVYDYRDLELIDGMTLEIEQDEYCESPRENECSATFYCVSNRRYAIGDVIMDGDSLHGKQAELLATGEYAMLPIYIYDHSGVALSTVPFADQWDSACIGFAVAKIKDFSLPDMNRKFLSAKKRAENRIRTELEEYSDYINGNCWWFSIKDEDGNEIDSCGGFIGDDLEKNGMMDYIRDYIA